MTSSTADRGMEPPDWPDLDPDHELTWRQQKILHFIRYYAEHHGYMPACARSARQPSWPARPASPTNYQSCSARDTYGELPGARAA